MVSALNNQVCLTMLQMVERTAQGPLSPESAAKLRGALDMVHTMIKTASVVDTVAQKLIQLYGRLDSCVMEFEMREVVQKAQEGNFAAVKQFYSKYAPALKERLVIELSLANIDLSEEAYLAMEAIVEEGMNNPSYARYLFRQLSPALQKALQRFMNEAFDFPHEVEGAAHDYPTRDFYDFRGTGA